MHKTVEYDAFADIYDIWVETAPVTKRNLPFYVEEYLRTAGPVVELGVGNGRIAIEAARQGKPVIGVDSSAEMLKLCRERAETAGVAHLLTLIQADFRHFVLPEGIARSVCGASIPTPRPATICSSGRLSATTLKPRGCGSSPGPTNWAMTAL